MKEAIQKDSFQVKERLDSDFKSFHTFDLRILALEKLRNATNGSDFIRYRDARCILGRSLHLSKKQSSNILRQMSRDGLLKFNMRGKIFLKNLEER